MTKIFLMPFALRTILLLTLLGLPAVGVFVLQLSPFDQWQKLFSIIIALSGTFGLMIGIMFLVPVLLLGAILWLPCSYPVALALTGVYLTYKEAKAAVAQS